MELSRLSVTFQNQLCLLYSNHRSRIDSLPVKMEDDEGEDGKLRQNS